ncbi:MAG: hypothetical protein HQK83_19160 [Fibrobacteria bacterium]|nr:hypothetical protein [Fibrobacteria bacterium]
MFDISILKKAIVCSLLGLHFILSSAYAVGTFRVPVSLSKIAVSDDRQSFQHGGLTREYILYVPPGLPDGAPLVFALHGTSEHASAELAREYMYLDGLADEHKFAVCYPQGTKSAYEMYFWNVGYDFHKNETVDDLDFLKSLARYLQQEYKFNPQNTFVTGFSNGADACFLLASKGADVFKAAAPVGGGLMKWIYDSHESHPIPLFIINGTKDPKSNWFGDMNNSEGWGAYLGVMDNTQFWVEENNTTGDTVYNVQDADKADGSHIVFYRYWGGTNGNQVWLYKIEDGEHDWPGSFGNMDIIASQHIWAFFQQHIKTPPVKHPPEVAFVIPQTDTILSGGDNLYVRVDAKDEDRDLSYVSLFLEDSLIGIDSLRPFEWNKDGKSVLLQNLKEGVYNLITLAEDKTGRSAKDSIKITVTKPTYLKKKTSSDNPVIENFDYQGLRFQLSKEGAYRLSFISIDGKKISVTGYGRIGENFVHIPLNDFSKGLYILRLHINGNTFDSKLYLME